MRWLRPPGVQIWERWFELWEVRQLLEGLPEEQLPFDAEQQQLELLKAAEGE